MSRVFRSPSRTPRPHPDAYPTPAEISRATAATAATTLSRAEINRQVRLYRLSLDDLPFGCPDAYAAIPEYFDRANAVDPLFRYRQDREFNLHDGTGRHYRAAIRACREQARARSNQGRDR